MDHMKGLRRGSEAAAQLLDRPRLAGARRLPEQLSRFLGTTLGNQRLIEGLLKFSTPLGFSRRIAGLARLPFGSLVTGDSGLESRVAFFPVLRKRPRITVAGQQRRPDPFEFELRD